MGILVNGELVADEIVRQEAEMLRPRYEEMMQDMDPVAREVQLREWSRENVIERVVLRQEACKSGEAVPEELMAEELERLRPTGEGCEDGLSREEFDEAAARKEIETRIRVERLVGKVSGKVAAPKGKDVTEYYKKHEDRFWMDEMIRAAHVVKNVGEGADEATARAGIEAALAELEGGASFNEVADKHSDCAGNGGDLGYFSRGDMVEEFENAVLPLPVGGRTGIFRSAFGFHIALVLDKKAAAAVPLNDVRKDIEATLLREKQERALEIYLDKLLAGATVENVKAAAEE